MYVVHSPFACALRAHLGHPQKIFNSADDVFLHQALLEAEKGIGTTHPNPPVGCVIVKNGDVIARGFHKRAGMLHAEAVALHQAGGKAAGATMYVSLEPCVHVGKKTPPCVGAIIDAGIKRVVVGATDPNTLVNTKGIAALRSAGIVVDQCADPSLASYASMLIKPFEKRITHQMPWVLAKIATSLDGRTTHQSGTPIAVTSAESQRVVHKLRHLSDAILVGSNTVLCDDPRLNVRDIGEQPHQPLRIVLDSTLKTSPSARVFAAELGPSLVVHTELASTQQMRIFDQACVPRLMIGSYKGRVSLSECLRALGSQGITSLMLEGGGTLLSAFLMAQLVDELWWFTAPQIFGASGDSALRGLFSRPLELKERSQILVGGDILNMGLVQNN